jgi:predicted AAA+ superfamily ATPase
VIGDEGARFENLVATHLLKRLHYTEDLEGHRCELRYVRDKEGREVDFVVLKDGEIEELIEVKYTEANVTRPLRYYVDRLRPKKATQIGAKLKRPYSRGDITVTDPISYFSGDFFQA